MEACVHLGAFLHEGQRLVVCVLYHILPAGLSVVVVVVVDFCFSLR